MNEVIIENKRRLLPGSWNELSRSQLLYVAKLFSDKHTIIDFKIMILFKFLKIKRSIFKKISPEDAWGISETLRFLLNDVSLTLNKIKSFRAGIRRYHGPDDHLKNVTFGEFIQMSIYLDNYNRDRSIENLDAICGILYRRKKIGWCFRKHFSTSTDCRIQFKEKNIQQNCKRMNSVNFGIKYSVYLLASGVYSELPGRFKHVFKKSGKSHEDTDNMWIDLVIGLADGKTDDDSLERIMNSNMYNVLFGLEKSAREYHELKKEMEAKR